MPGPSKTHDGQDLPDYDLALETALDRLDDYQDSRSLMDKHLKSVSVHPWTLPHGAPPPLPDNNHWPLPAEHLLPPGLL